MAKTVKKTAAKKTAKKKTATRKKAPARKTKGKSIYDTEREALDQRKRSGGSSDYWKPGDGRSTIRPLTFMDDEGDERLFVEDVRHWIDLGDDEKQVVQCGGSDCPICALKNEVSKEIWGEIKPDKYMLVNVVHREGGEDGEDCHKIAKLRKTAYEQLADYLFNSMVKQDPLSLTKGIDFKVVRSGTGFKTKYKVLPAQRTSKAGDFADSVVDLASSQRETDMEALEELAGSILEKFGS